MKDIESIEQFNFDVLQLDNDFWQFSLSAWKNKDLQACLLDCQNRRGLRVNQILFALWASTEGLCLRTYFESKPKVLDVWHTEVLQPIRCSRKVIPKQEKLLQLRQDLQQRELQAEQIEQALMHHFLTLNLGQKAEKKVLDTLLNNLVLSGVNDSALLLMLTKLFTEVCSKPLLVEEDIVARICERIDNMD